MGQLMLSICGFKSGVEGFGSVLRETFAVTLMPMRGRAVGVKKAIGKSKDKIPFRDGSIRKVTTWRQKQCVYLHAGLPRLKAPMV